MDASLAGFEGSWLSDPLVYYYLFLEDASGGMLYYEAGAESFIKPILKLKSFSNVLQL